MGARAGARVGRRVALPVSSAADARVPVRRGGRQPLGGRHCSRAAADGHCARARPPFIPRPKDAKIPQGTCAGIEFSQRCSKLLYCTVHYINE